MCQVTYYNGTKILLSSVTYGIKKPTVDNTRANQTIVAEQTAKVVKKARSSRYLY